MNKSPSEEFFPNDFNDLNDKLDNEPNNVKNNSTFFKFIKMGLIFLIIIVVIIIIYSIFIKSTENDNTVNNNNNSNNNKSNNNKFTTEHENIINNVSEEELLKVLEGQTNNKSEINNERNILLNKHAILDISNLQNINRINPAILSNLFLGMKIKDDILKNENYKINQLDNIILDYNSGILTHLYQQQNPKEDIPESLEKQQEQIKNNELEEKLNDNILEQINTVEDNIEHAESVEDNEIKTQSINGGNSGKKPIPKRGRGRKPTAKKSKQVDVVSESDDSVQNLKVELT